MDGSLILSIVLLGIIFVFAIIFFVVTKRQEKIMNDGNSKGKASNKKNNEEVKRVDVFKFMEFDRILDDMIVQKGGLRYTMAIKCKGINYDLMSDVEQYAVEEGFITFLNTLRYPIQIYVQAQNVDLKGAINKYKENISTLKNEFNEIDYKYSKAQESFDISEREISELENERNKILNVYEYASDIVNYVERMSINKSLLQRNFYILVSYNVGEITAADQFSKDELVNMCYSELMTRCIGIINALGSCSVDGKILNSNELADLLYAAYNRDDKGLLSVKEAIDSGFYRLYSTSKDAFYKRQERLQAKIQNEAQIRAYEALRKAINNGTYVSDTTEAMDMDEEISKLAVDKIKREAVPDEVKVQAKNIIMSEYRETKREFMKKIEEEKKEILDSNAFDFNKEPKKEVSNEFVKETADKKMYVGENDALKDRRIDIEVSSNGSEDISQNYSRVSNATNNDIELKNQDVDTNVLNTKQDYNNTNSLAGDMSNTSSDSLFDDRFSDEEDELL